MNHLLSIPLLDAPVVMVTVLLLVIVGCNIVAFPESFTSGVLGQGLFQFLLDQQP